MKILQTGAIPIRIAKRFFAQNDPVIDGFPGINRMNGVTQIFILGCNGNQPGMLGFQYIADLVNT